MADALSTIDAPAPAIPASMRASSSVQATIDALDAALRNSGGDSGVGDGVTPAPNAGASAPASAPSPVDATIAALDRALASSATQSKQDRPQIPLSDVPADVVNSGAQGVIYGAMAGIPSTLRTVRDLGARGQNWLIAHGASALGMLPEGKTAQELFNDMNGLDAQFAGRGLDAALGPTYEQAKALPDYLTGGEYKPRSVPGDYAKTIGEFLPLAGKNLISAGVIPAVASETAGQLTAGTGFEPAARLGGAVLGGIGAGVAGSAISGGVDRAVLAAEPILSPEASAARYIAGRAQDFDAVDRTLNPGPMRPGEAPNYEMVPGSTPSLATLTGDRGLLQEERALRNGRDDEAKNAFIANDQEQASKRTEALSGIQEAGSPADVAARFRQISNEIDNATQAQVDAITPAANDAEAAIGGRGGADATGYALRKPMEDARAASKENENKLWGLVNPNLSVPSMGIAETANRVKGEMSRSATPMSGEEARIFDVAAGYADNMPFNELKDLRSAITDASAQARQAGNMQTTRRLDMLRRSLDDSMDHGIENQAALDQIAVSRGTMAPEDALSARIKSWGENFNDRENAAAAGGGGDNIPPTAELAGASSVSGATRQTGRGFRSDAGAEAVPGEALPPATPADVAAYKDAKQATRERAETFDEGVPGQVLQSAPRGGYKMPDAAVVSAIAPGGKATDPHVIRQFLAAGGSPDALSDAIAYTIRKQATDADGVLNPGKVYGWLAKNKEALAELPADVAAKFKTAADTRQAVFDMAAKRKDALDAFNNGALAKVAGLSDSADVVKSIGGIFGSQGAVQKMRDLATAAAGDPAAAEGLRRAIVDHVLNKLTSNTSINGSGVNALKSDAFMGFVRQNSDVLRQVFSPKEMDTFAAVGADLDRAARIHQTKGLTSSPGTAQDLAANKGSILQGLLGEAGAASIAAGAHFAGAGPLGSAAAWLGAKTLGRLQAAGLASRDAIVREAMVNPTVARTLLAKLPVKPDQGTAAALGHQLAVIASRAAASDLNRR
ncbi:hypothetical protein [uncultured Rhodoblastus sp.]|uniref:hypothetical protein n=1 Tax=uncultured Rhodoblastus sp. TaxID=543037 RepID=UPI0025F7839C|nr:hypothetical protein [uncultured Rhodoblastus sp.]